ncbi:hypothetical protein BC834DRAFT_856603 [Gloeopeniophorella convolvens]|nr:hypothetical protein BC834DRAFT_856603 [Gloeopeniophorella convolvens]
MSVHAGRLSRFFTAEYTKRINAQIVYPAQSIVVKPNELESALNRPVQVSVYEPHRPAPYLAATLSYGIIKGHPFQDGNKRTAFFVVNEYKRAMGITALGDTAKDGEALESVATIAERHINCAAGQLDVAGLAGIASDDPSPDSA